MQVAILGYAVEGAISAAYWAASGNDVTVRDVDPEVAVPDTYTKQTGADYLKNLHEFDVIVRTAGLHPRDISLANPDHPEVMEKVTTSLNEFMAKCPSKNIIGITGTKGKGTTTTLVAEMLKANGKTVHLGGNIGIAPLELLPQVKPDEWVLLELSSFQLIDLKTSPSIGVCLMITPEHLNWHADMQEYIHAKQNLFQWQKPDGIAIYYAANEDSLKIASVSSGQKLPYMASPGAEVVEGAISIDGQTICKTSELKMLGEHNWQNACAAVTVVWQIDKNIKAMHKVLSNFSGLPHRIELVRELNGVKYYDDSFATTPETTMACIAAFKEPKVVILGGSNKGASFQGLADTIAYANIRQVIVINNAASADTYGDTGPEIARLLREHGITNITEGLTGMPEIVAAASAAAQEGDVVLLSTACASFGLFKNYKDRGEQFKAAVQALV